MPITLPTTSTSTSTSPSDPSPSSPQNIHLNTFLATLKPRLLPPLNFTTTPGKSAAATVILRGTVNALFFLALALGSRRIGGPARAWCLYYLADQLVVTYCVSTIVEVQGNGGRRRVPVLGWRVGERFFELFLVACGVAHVLYMFFLAICVVSFAIFFGVTGGTALTAIGVCIVVVGVLASLPEDEEEGGLSIV